MNIPRQADSSTPDTQHRRVDLRRRMERLAWHRHADVERIRIRVPADRVADEALRRSTLQYQVGRVQLPK